MQSSLRPAALHAVGGIASLAEVYLPEGEKLYWSEADIENCFYECAIPEGMSDFFAFESRDFLDYMALMNIEYVPAAGEAHWQVGAAERGIKTIKGMMKKVLGMHPQATGPELASACTAAFNEMERIYGYSPNQWAWEVYPGLPSLDQEGEPQKFERAIKIRMDAQKIFIEHRVQRREAELLRAKNRCQRTFEAGELIYVWRAGKGKEWNATKVDRTGSCLIPSAGQEWSTHQDCLVHCRRLLVPLCARASSTSFRPRSHNLDWEEP